MKLNIIAATDETRAGLAAVKFATQVASASKARLSTLTVGELAPRIVERGPGRRRLSGYEGSELRAVRAALENARRETRRVAASHSDYVSARWDEPFAATISRVADRRGADLIVVGSRGGTPLRRWLLGSIANRLLHLARVPVAVVRPGARKSTNRAARILVATDGSSAAMKAVRFAARLTASIPGARLVILTVSTLTADIALTGPGVVRALGMLPELERADRRSGTKILERAAKQTRLGKRVTLRYYRPTRPRFAEKAILEEATRQRADMIVLGRTGRTALGDVLLGSVAQRVLALANRPVILVPRGRGVKRARGAVSKRR